MTTIEPVISGTGIRWGGDPVRQMRYNAPKKAQYFTRDTIVRQVTAIQKSLRDKKFKGIMQVSLLYPNGPQDWRTNKGWFDFNANPELYRNDYYPDRAEDEDPATYKSFTIMVKQTKSKK